MATSVTLTTPSPPDVTGMALAMFAALGLQRVHVHQGAPWLIRTG
jgi:hypothetical protein